MVVLCVAAPGGCDDQYGFVKGVSDDIAKAEPRADRRILRAITGSEFAFAPEEPNRDVVTLHPFFVLVF